MITKEIVAKISRLAKIEISDEDLEAFAKDLDHIVSFADTINEFKEPCDLCDQKTITNVFREDRVSPSVDRKYILENAQDKDGEYFCVSKKS